MSNRLKVVKVLEELWQKRPTHNYHGVLPPKFSHDTEGVDEKDLVEYKQRLDELLNIKSYTLMVWYCKGINQQLVYKWHQDDIRKPNITAYVLGYPHPTEYIPSEKVDFNKVVKRLDHTVIIPPEYESYCKTDKLGIPLLVDNKIIHRTNNQHPESERMCVKLVCTK